MVCHAHMRKRAESLKKLLLLRDLGEIWLRAPTNQKMCEEQAVSCSREPCCC